MHSATVDIPAGTTVRIDMKLRGTIVPAATYRLSLPHQPLAADDRVTVRVDTVAPWRVIGSGTRGVVLDQDRAVVMRFGPR